MKYGFDGKVVIVTGGSKGLGKGIVKDFLQENAKVIFTARTEEQGKAAAEDLSQYGEVEYIKSDVSSEEDVKALVKHVVDKYGKLDFIVNNAAYLLSPDRTLHEYDYETVQNAYKTNVGGVFLLMKYGIEQMLTQPEKGAIVNISSMAGTVTWKKYSIYGSTKRAVNAMTQIAAHEYAEQGIRINAIIAGSISTERFAWMMEHRPEITTPILEQVPMKRFVSPEELGQTVMWLCSDQAAYITGVLLPVDGGMTL